jgi:N-acetyl-anhydromuramyl-L-alanine amidase AmpD
MDEAKENGASPAPVDTVTLLAAQEAAALWQARAAYLHAQAERTEQARAALEENVIALRAQLVALEAHAAEMQSGLAHADMRLQTTRAAAPARQASLVVRPLISDVTTLLAHSADANNAYPQRPLARIRHLVLHHTGAADASLTPWQMAEFHVNDPKHQWPGIGFHYFIAANGDTYQTNHLETVCYHVVDNNPTSVGIVLAGQFDDAPPPDAQLTSTAALLAWLMQELHLPPESIVGHNEFAAQQTSCPGARWQADGGWKDDIVARVRWQSLQPVRPIYHYLLFWQTETGWADADFQAAARYIARFRPTLGFSAHEAAHAEHVTIVGSVSGVSKETEDILRAAGCRVQRIAGKNNRETRALLDALAGDGRRFVS